MYIVTRDAPEARQLGRLLVEEKLAACVNILPQMESFYWWEGKVESGEEAVLIAKTEKKKEKALIERVRKSHSYSCPCVLSLPVQGGNPAYLQWLAESVK